MGSVHYVKHANVQGPSGGLNSGSNNSLCFIRHAKICFVFRRKVAMKNFVENSRIEGLFGSEVLTTIEAHYQVPQILPRTVSIHLKNNS